MREAIVLAGGLGTRLRSVVPDLPKVMAPIRGRPFLELILSALARKGFDRVVLSLGYMAGSVVRHFGSRFPGIDLLYEIESHPLGTGGALRRALGRLRTDHALIVNGDTFLDIEADAVEALWRRERTPIIVARQLADTSRYGRLVVSNDIVIGFTGKDVPGSGLINAGHYVFPSTIVDRFPETEAFSLENDFLAKQATATNLRVFVSRGSFIDIGVPEDYARAQSELVDAC
jgi:D-glycero-alpha-D-manno-heptose 1-phosphate guanylyltransferase